jgi:hypothetical protein
MEATIPQAAPGAEQQEGLPSIGGSNGQEMSHDDRVVPLQGTGQQEGFQPVVSSHQATLPNSYAHHTLHGQELKRNDGNNRCCSCCKVFAGLVLFLLVVRVGLLWWVTTRYPIQIGLEYMGARCNSFSAKGCNPYQLSPVDKGLPHFDLDRILLVKPSDMTHNTDSYAKGSAVVRIDKTASSSSSDDSDSFGIGLTGENCSTSLVIGLLAKSFVHETCNCDYFCH